MDSQKFSSTTSATPFNFVFSTFEKISENPYAIFFYVLFMMQTVAMYLSNDYDPVVILVDLLQSILSQPDLPRLLKLILLNLLKIFGAELKYRRGTVLFFMFSLPSMIQFNIAYFVLEIIFSVIFFYAKTYSLWMTVVIVHFWYIYRLNKTFPRIYVLVMLIASMYIFHELDHKDTLLELDYTSINLKIQNTQKNFV